MLKEWITQNEDSSSFKRAIVRFGRQSDGSYVTSNAVFLPCGDCVDISLTDWVVVKEFFEPMDLRPRSFPRNFIINNPLVRYFVFKQWWHKVIPAYFQTNSIQARVTFAFGVMGLHTNRIFNGEGVTVGDGFPIGWLHSYDPGTGKSSIAKAIHRMYGFPNRTCGAETTVPAIYDRVASQADMTLFIEDKEINQATKGSFSTLARNMYDRTDRLVSKKLRTPYSGLCFSVSLVEPNAVLAPFQSTQHAADVLVNTGW